jgi:hypothetical protein
MMADGYRVVDADEAEDAYADSDVPGEFRSLTEAVGAEQLASHRNRGDEPVEMWAVSRRSDDGDSTKVDDFWEASPAAHQTR